MFEKFEDAEAALLEYMRKEAGGKEVTLVDTPMKLRFGRGRNRTAGGDSNPT